VRRILARLSRSSATPDDMRALHGDDVSLVRRRSCARSTASRQHPQAAHG
jgi:hypothetical protein